MIGKLEYVKVIVLWMAQLVLAPQINIYLISSIRCQHQSELYMPRHCFILCLQDS